MKRNQREHPENKGQDLRSLRNNNLQMLLTEIWQHAPISRITLSERTGLAPSSVTRLINELGQLGLIEELANPERQRGRQPILIAPNRRAGFVISLDLSGSELRAGLFDSANNKEFEISEPYTDFKTESIGDQAIQLVRRLLRDPRAAQRRFLGIGVSVPGIVDPTTGAIADSYNLGLHDYPLQALLHDEFQCLVYVEHDASAAAAAERYYGAARGEDNFIYVMVSNGIGSGVILNGHIYRGQSGRLGQLGHVILHPDGPLCVCGQYGCLEALASVPALLGNARKVASRWQQDGRTDTAWLATDPMRLTRLAEAARTGDSVARSLFERAAGHIAHAISIYVTLFDLHLVIVGGELPDVGDVFLDPLQATLGRFLTTHRNLRVSPSQMRADGNLRGVSLLAIQELLRFV